MPSRIDPDTIVLSPTVDLSTMDPRPKMRAIRIMATDPLALADVLDLMSELLFDPKIGGPIKDRSPDFFDRCRKAMAAATPKLPNPYTIEGEAVLYRDLEAPQYVRVESGGTPEDPRLMVRKGDGLLIGLMGWDYRIRPEDPE